MAKLSTTLLISSVLVENQVGGVESACSLPIHTPLSQLQNDVKAIRKRKR